MLMFERETHHDQIIGQAVQMAQVPVMRRHGKAVHLAGQTSLISHLLHAVPPRNGQIKFVRCRLIGN